MNHHDQTLSELGEKLGLTLSFDDERHCLLLLDESLIASIKSQESGWIFIGQLEHVVEFQEDSFWKNLLSTNLSLAEKHAGSICYEQTANTLLYLHRLPEEELNADKIYSFLEDFFNELEKIKEHFNFI